MMTPQSNAVAGAGSHYHRWPARALSLATRTGRPRYIAKVLRRSTLRSFQAFPASLAASGASTSPNVIGFDTLRIRYGPEVRPTTGARFRPPMISSRCCPFMSDSSRSRGLTRAHPRHRNNNRRSYRAVDETAEAAPVDAQCAGVRRARSRAARRRSSSRHNRAAWHTIDRSAAGPTSDHTRRMNLRLCHCHAAPCCCHARKGSVSSL